jgi:hypothetical protein
MLVHGWIDRGGKAMRKYHVILEDELGEEFSVELEAMDRDDAWDTVQMDYPESRVVAALELKRYVRED